MGPARRSAGSHHARPEEAFVWAWVPGAVHPVVAGVLERERDRLVFSYGQSYLERTDAIPLYLPELPLAGEVIDPPAGMHVAGCLRDAAPDAWGQQIILARLAADGRDLSEDLLTFMLESGSDRIGGLDFQVSPTEYVSRDAPANLDELLEAATRFAEGKAVSEALSRALLHGTSIGGARPKALLVAQEPDSHGQVLERHLIAKFSLSQDPYPVVKAEAVAMNLARRVGLDVAPSELVARAGRDVLLVERFDRPETGGTEPGRLGERRIMVSALTILGLPEEYGRHATYPALADSIRKRFTSPKRTLRELFARVVFNILVSNTDDHARNHSAFWDGSTLSLTPAYDISPQLRSGETGAQAMAIARDGARASKVAVAARAAADVFAIQRDEAQQIIDGQVDTIRNQWSDAADECELTRADRQLMWERMILNPGVFRDEDPAFDTYGS
jgi:serine/threonine-protein kinase HipA